MHALLIAALLAFPVHADQTKFEVDKANGRWTFDVRWTDAEGAAHQAEFVLPAAAVRADIDEAMRFRQKEAAQFMLGEIRSWAASRRGPKVSARANAAGEIRISAKGSDRKKVKEALAEASEVREQALETYMAEHGFTWLDDGIVPDHIRHVQDYAGDLAPVVRALGGPGDDPRAFASLALGFVQSIPYEQASKQRDRYRRPLSLLGRNRGDCDSKATLYLALMHQAWPELPVAMVDIPGHAFVGLGIEAEKGEQDLKDGDQRWLLAEPVGPAMAPLGELGKKSKRRARRRKVELKVLETE
jgi:hypothetical protein